MEFNCIIFGFVVLVNELFLTFVSFSLLITATGHIKLTDFGLSKIGLMSCKYIVQVAFKSNFCSGGCLYINKGVLLNHSSLSSF